MHFVLLVFGVLLAALGAGLLVWGYQVLEFSLGNTLIIGGLIALTGGLLLVGLSMAVRQLRRIAETLDLQPMAWTAGAAVAAGAAEPVVPRPAPPVPAVLSPIAVDDDADDEASVAPVKPEPPLRAAEPVAMPKPRRSLRDWIEHGGARTVPADDIPQPVGEPSRPRAEPAAAPPKAEEPRRSFLSRRPARTERVAPEAPDPEAGAVTVYKSGVVEGMAYSLYTAGSIDAELPEGTVRFGSLDALRQHLASRR